MAESSDAVQKVIVERMARVYAAWHITHNNNRSADDPYVMEWVENQWRNFEDLSRHVLLEIREPTETMGDAGNIYGYWPITTFRSMIDAALVETSSQ